MQEPNVKLDEASRLIWDGLVKRAANYLIEQQYSKALADYTQALDIFSTCSLLVSRAKCHVALGQITEALHDFHQAVQTSEPFWGYVERGWFYANQKQFSLALNDLNLALSKETINSTAYAYRAIVLSQIGQIEAAVIDVNSAFNISDAGISYVAKAFVMFAQNQYEQVLNNLHWAQERNVHLPLADILKIKSLFALKRFADTIFESENFLTIHPQQIEVMTLQIRSLHALGRFHEAIESLNTLIRWEPSAYHYYWRGEVYQQVGNYAKSNVDLTQSLNLQEDVSSLHLRAISWEKLGKKNLAEQDIDRLLVIQPLHVNGLLKYAEYQLQYGHIEQALKSYESILSHEGQVPEGLLGRARCLIAQGKEHLALSDIETVLATRKDATAYLLQAKVFLSLKELQSALNAVQQAIRLGSQLESFQLRADIWLALQSYPEAISDLLRVKEILPNLSTLTSLAKAYFYNKNYELTIEYLSECMEMEKNEPSLWMVRGKAFFHLNAFEQAKHDFSLVLQKKTWLEALWLRGQCCFQLGEYQLALHDFERIDDYDHDFFKVERKILIAKSLKAMSLEERAKEILDETILGLQTVLQQGTGGKDEFFWLAQAFNELDNHNQALLFMQKAIALEPNFQLYVFRAKLNQKMNKLKDAIADGERALHFFENLEVFNVLASVYWQMGQVDRAVDTLEHSMLWLKERSLAERSKIILQIVEFYRIRRFIFNAQKGEEQLAVGTFQEMSGQLESYRRSCFVYQLLAYVSFDLKDYKASIRYARIALKFNSQLSDLYKLQAQAYLESHDYQPAIEQFTVHLNGRLDSVSFAGRANAWFRLQSFEKVCDDSAACIAHLNVANVPFVFSEEMKKQLQGSVYELWAESLTKLKKHEEAYFTFIKALNFNSTLKLYEKTAQSGILAKKYSESIDILSRGIQFFNEASLYEMRAEVYTQLEMFEPAIKDYNYLGEHVPLTAKLLYKKAVCLLNFHQPDPALHLLLKSYEKKKDGKTAAKIAQTYFDLDEITVSLQWIEEAFKYDQFVELYEVRAKCNERLHKQELAVDDYQRAILIEPNQSLYFSRGSLLKQMQRYELASSDFSKAIDIEPLAKYYFNRAQCWMALKDYEPAILDFSASYDKDDSLVEALRLRGECWFEVRSFENALIDFEKVIALKPDDLLAYNNRGVTRYKCGQLELALTDYNIVLEADPAFYLAYYNRAMAYLDLQQYDRSIGDLSRVLRLDPNYQPALMARSKAFVKINRIDQAITDVSKLLLHNEQHLEGFILRANCYMQQGFYQKAADDYSQVLAIKPESEYYLHRAKAWQALEAYDKALLDLNHLIALDPSKDNYIHRSNLFLRQRDFNNAIIDCTTALSLSVEASSYQSRANIYKEQGNLTAALEDILKAEHLSVQDSTIISDLGKIRLLRQEYELAVREFSRSLQLQPCADVYLHRSKTLLTIGRVDQALYDIQESLKIKPDFLPAVRQRAILNYHKNLYAQALRDIETVILAEKSSNEKIDEEIRFYRLNCLYMTNDFETLISDCTLLEQTTGVFQDQTLRLHANSLFKLSRWEEAEKAYTQLLIKIRELDIYLNRGRCYFNLDRYQPAEEDFDEAIRLSKGTHPLAYYYKGMCEYAQKQYSQSLKNLEMASSLVADTPIANINIALACAAALSGQYTLSINYANGMISEKEVTSRLIRSYSFIKLGKFENALSDLITVTKTGMFVDANWYLIYLYGKMDNHQKLIEEATYLIKAGKADVAIYNNRGWAFIQLGYTEQAINDFTVAIEHTETLALACYNRALLYYHKNQWEWSLSDISKAIELESNQAMFYYLRGMIQSDLKNYPEAIADFTTCLECQPNYLEAYLKRGSAYGYLNRASEAMDDFSLAMKLNPQHPLNQKVSSSTTSNNFGLDYQLSQPELTIIELPLQVFNKKEAVTPYIIGERLAEQIEKWRVEHAMNKQTDVRNWLKDQVHWADASFEKEKLPEIPLVPDLQLYQREVENLTLRLKDQPQSVEGYYQRARAYEGLRKLDQAIEDYTKAIEIDPRNKMAIFQRANIWRNLGEFDLALKDLDSMLEVDAKSVNACFVKGDIYAKQGKIKEGIPWYSKAISFINEYKVQPEMIELYVNNEEEQPFLKEIASCNQRITKNGRDAEAYHSRGKAYFELREYHKAVKDFERSAGFNQQRYVSVLSQILSLRTHKSL